MRAKCAGDVTTINLTMLKAGVTGDNGKTWALNVIPTEAEAGMRHTPRCDLAVVQAPHRYAAPQGLRRHDAHDWQGLT